MENNDPDTCARYNAIRVADRQTDELIGMIRMALSDGAFDRHEAAYMCAWLEANDGARTCWPGDVIYEQLRRALTHGAIYEEHEHGLLVSMHKAIGHADPTATTEKHSRLPITDPPPHITFEGKCFCLTGRFVFGQRDLCAKHIVARGGTVTNSVTKAVDYLVIGLHGSDEWIHSTHGRKIQQAQDMSARGKPIAIILEDHWTAALEATY